MSHIELSQTQIAGIETILNKNEMYFFTNMDTMKIEYNFSPSKGGNYCFLASKLKPYLKKAGIAKFDSIFTGKTLANYDSKIAQISTMKKVTIETVKK